MQSFGKAQSKASQPGPYAAGPVQTDQFSAVPKLPPWHPMGHQGFGGGEANAFAMPPMTMPAPPAPPTPSPSKATSAPSTPTAGTWQGSPTHIGDSPAMGHEVNLDKWTNRLEHKVPTSWDQNSDPKLWDANEEYNMTFPRKVVTTQHSQKRKEAGLEWQDIRLVDHLNKGS